MLTSRKCKTHPTYSARKAPGSDCKTCQRMWTTKNRLHRAIALATKTIGRLFPEHDYEVSVTFKTPVIKDMSGYRMRSLKVR